MNRSVGKIIAAAALLAAMTASPLWAAEPATEACKTCVTRCVMSETDGKAFNACFAPPWVQPPGDCNAQCPGVNRSKLRSELWKTSREKCEADLVPCLEAAGNDNMKIMLCRGEEASCKARASRFQTP